MSKSDFWSGRSVLLTGAGGFLGSWLAEELVQRGAQVICLLHGQEKTLKLELHGIHERVIVVRGSVVDSDFLADVFAKHSPDTCFHLAAQAIVGSANRSPVPTFETNVRGTWNVLEACRQSESIERVVVASSDKAYGDQPVLPYTEDLPLSGAYPYDASKACAEVIVRSYARTYGVPIAVTRMANLYGGGDLNASRVVPGTIRSILNGEDPIIRSDGTPIRDYLYVSDAVDAYLTLGSQPADTLQGEAFNFGTNSPVSVLDLVDLIIEVMGAEGLEPKVMSPTKLHGEIDRQFLDSGKALRVLGWRARMPLRDGLEQTVAWYREHPVDDWLQAD